MYTWKEDPKGLQSKISKATMAQWENMHMHMKTGGGTVERHKIALSLEILSNQVQQSIVRQ